MVGREMLCSPFMNTPKPHPPISWHEGRRLRAWELHQQGWTQQLIAQALGVTQGAVSQWLKRATLHGPEALRDHPAPGAQPLLTVEQQAQLAALLLEGAEAFGFRGDVWTCRRVAQLIKDQFAVSYHPAHVSRILAHLGWTPQKPIIRATQRDEQAIAAWYDERWPLLKKSAEPKAELSSG
jgi:transposase